MTTLEDLLAGYDALNAARAAAGFPLWSDSTMGSYSVANPKFVASLRSGKTNFVQEFVYARARAWLKAERKKLEAVRKSGVRKNGGGK